MIDTTGINTVNTQFDFWIEIIKVLTPFILFFLARIPIIKISSIIYRRNKEIPDIIGKEFKTIWYKGEEKIPYVEDKIKFKSWKKNNKFIGEGELYSESKNKKYIYTIEGEITAHRIIIFSYKAQGYPTAGFIGNVCMYLELDSNAIHGYWEGLVNIKKEDGSKDQDITQGRVLGELIN